MDGRLGKVWHGAVFGDGNVPPTRQWLAEQEDVACPVALVLIVETLRPPRFGWYWRPLLPDQLFAGFIKADRRALGVIGLLIQVQHIFHTGDKVGTYLRDAPLLFLPGLEFVFLSVRRTLSYDMESANPNSTTLSASKRNVQRAWPSGGSLHATAMRWASSLPSSLLQCPGRGRSLEHFPTPLQQNASVCAIL